MPKTKRRDQTWGDTSQVDDDRVAVTALDPGTRRRSRRKQRSAFTFADPQRVAELAAALGAGEVLPARRRATPDLPPEELERQMTIARGQHARAMPYRATAITAGVGVAAWGVGEFADLAVGAGTHDVTSLLVGTAVAGAAAWWRVAKRRLFEPGWGRRYWTATACAATWTTVAGSTGPTWGVMSALALTAGALASQWMRAHEVPHPADQPLAIEAGDGAAGPPTSMEAFAQRWRDLIGRDGGLLPGSILTGHTTITHGMEFELHFAGGKTLADVQANRERIASLLGVAAMQLVADPPPTTEAGFPPASRARLRYLTSSPVLSALTDWRPAYEAGRVPIGPYIDGEGTADVVLHTRNSCWSVLVVGDTGSGKSSTATGIVAGGRASGCQVTVYFDPKESSSPELAATASVAVRGMDRAEDFTRRVERFTEGRRLDQAARGESGFNETSLRPRYLFVVDECDILFQTDGMAARWGYIAKTLRALGGQILGITQTGEITVFGGDNRLRGSLSTANVVLHRCGTGGTGQLIAKRLPAPSTLPQEPGFGYLQARDSRTGAAFRSGHLRSAQDIRDEGNDPRQVWGALRALLDHPDAAMDEVGLAVFGDLAELDGDQEERQAAVAAESAARYAAWLRSMGTDGATAQAEPAAASALDGSPWGPVPAPLLAPEPQDAPVAASVPAVFEPVDGPSTPEGLTANQAAVWAVLPAAGSVATSEVVAKSSLRKDAVSRALSALARRQLAVSPARGRWGRATASS